MARLGWFWAALAAVLLLAGAPVMMRLFALPSINDITTDTADPPAFTVQGAPAYPPHFAAQQHAAYPAVVPAMLSADPATAFDRVLAAAGALGWEITASDRPAGRIEATVTTRWWRFTDDIVVRIRPTAEGSRTDIRSRSRLGSHDFGANAARITAFLDHLTP